MIFVNNMGESGRAESRWIGPDLVSTTSSIRGGKPTLGRSIYKVNKAGAFNSTVSTVLVGAEPPAISFEGSHVKKD